MECNPPAKHKNYCAYLLRLVRNAAYNRYCAAHTLKRNAANTAGSIDELAEIISDRGDVVDEVERREIIGAINGFLHELPQKQPAFILFHICASICFLRKS